MGRQRQRKKKSTLATVCGILPSASYALKPCAEDVQHPARCVSELPMSFLECLVCNHPTSQSVGRYKTDMRKVSTRFISVPRRHRSNTSTWYFWTVSCLFVCPSHLVRTHTTHRVFPLGVFHSAELFPDLAAPHFCEGYINNWTCSINSGTCSFSTRFFSSSAVVVQFLFLELFDASQKAFLFHIVFQVPFLGNTPHLQPRREPLEFPVGDR